MKAYEVQTDGGIDALARVDRPEPADPGPGEVLVAIRAASLNYRDLGIVRGGYLRNDTRPVVPLSDGAGEVLAAGENVTEWTPGDRVMPSFVRDWITGPPTDAALRTSLGGGVDGVLQERMVLPEDSLARVPDHMSYEEAACLPCAGLTAYHGLGFGLHGRDAEEFGLKEGQTVLTLGTGGVSVFALQIAKALGGRVLITSSSDEKLERAKSMGADEAVNYAATPDWHKEVLRLTGGGGVDHVIEVGGPGTLEKSLACTKVGGQIGLIGVLAGTDGRPNLMPAVFNCVRINGIYVGSSVMLRDFAAFCGEVELKPVVDRVFGFDEAKEAYRHLKGGGHFGKVVVRVGD